MQQIKSLKNRVQNFKSTELLISFVVLIFFLLIIVFVGTRSNNNDDEPQNDDYTITTTADSKDIFPKVIEKATNWAADFKILGCSGVTINSLEIDGEKLEFTGAENGKFASWSCNVFSASKKQSRTILWNKGELVLSDPINLEDNVSSLIEARASFNELDSVTSSSEIFKKAKDKGLNTENNFYNFYIGEAVTNKFPKNYVWQIEERSKSEKDSNGVNKLISNYFYDAKTGEFLRLETTE